MLVVPYRYKHAILDWKYYYRADKQRAYLFIELARLRFCFNWRVTA